jgi:BA14K-like protein
MMNARTLAAGAVMLAAALSPVSSSLAAPAFDKAPAVNSANVLHKVWGRHGWGWGPWPWVGIGAGIVAGAIIADQTYRPRPGYYYDTYAYNGPYYYPDDYHGDPRQMCARYFRSFEWDTGYYTTYGGEHRLCPYLHR